jgi:hypothetical protein
MADRLAGELNPNPPLSGGSRLSPLPKNHQNQPGEVEKSGAQGGRGSGVIHSQTASGRSIATAATNNTAPATIPAGSGAIPNAAMPRNADAAEKQDLENPFVDPATPRRDRARFLQSKPWAGSRSTATRWPRRQKQAERCDRHGSAHHQHQLRGPTPYRTSYGLFMKLRSSVYRSRFGASLCERLFQGRAECWGHCATRTSSQGSGGRRGRARGADLFPGTGGMLGRARRGLLPRVGRNAGPCASHDLFPGSGGMLGPCTTRHLPRDRAECWGVRDQSRHAGGQGQNRGNLRGAARSFVECGADGADLFQGSGEAGGADPSREGCAQLARVSQIRRKAQRI